MIPKHQTVPAEPTQEMVDAGHSASVRLVNARGIYRAMLAAAPPPPETVDIVFDGPPGPASGRFVEVEDAAGKSINFGEWVDRPDGYWALRISPPEDRLLAEAVTELLCAKQHIEFAHEQFGAETETSMDCIARIDALLSRLRAQQPKATGDR